MFGDDTAATGGVSPRKKRKGGASETTKRFQAVASQTVLRIRIKEQLQQKIYKYDRGLLNS